WDSRASKVIADVLKRLPFLGRFIDVTTAEALYECYDPKHPLTRTEKRRCGERLLATVGRLGLVVGGEHGIWWGVPHQSYIEGMMSSYQFAWPAGHLIRPKDRNEKFSGPYGADTWENYERWGLGHEYRAPLWQLVFHDCVASTWYWGDSNDYLLKAAPELTPKKDAFNVLYGTMPMLWANREGAWHADREAFRGTVHTTTHVHAKVAEMEMTDHTFVTPDRAVQRTRFANGTVCYVNFGPRDRKVAIGGKAHILPRNGFAVMGPGIRQFRERVSNQTVTSVVARGFMLRETASGSVAAQAEGRGLIRVTVTARSPLRLSLADVMLVASNARERQVPKRIALYRRNADGARDALAYSGPVTGRAAALRAGAYDLLYGAALDAPDLSVTPASTRLVSSRVTQGRPLALRAAIRNVGERAATAATVAAYADAEQPDRLLARRTVTIGSMKSVSVRLSLPTDRMDGSRTILVVVRSNERDLCVTDNVHRLRADITPDPKRWAQRGLIEVTTTEPLAPGEIVVLPTRSKTVEPASVRVSELTSLGPRPCAAQWDALPEGPRLCFVPMGSTSSATVRRFRILWNERGSKAKPMLAPRADRYNPLTFAIRGSTYSCRLPDGVIRDVAVNLPGGGRRAVISKIMVSSAETGWTEEPGTVVRRSILADGPVRTVIEISKNLQAGVSYTKRYVFDADGFDVHADVRPQVGVASRSYYLAGGSFADSQGNAAIIDGSGDLEGVTHRASSPLWYEVRGADWAHSCIPLTPFGSITYWDSAEWGGIGFVGPTSRDQAFRYRLHPTAKAAGFAAADRDRITRRPVVTLVEGAL
ncbi:MAG: hypothetical protein FJX72_13455, partial [Armatimonadetes bacterium]|nr:hypothetical protein [Armatimonadota bacterium]